MSNINPRLERRLIERENSGRNGLGLILLMLTLALIMGIIMGLVLVHFGT
jgi:hypothetical protein